MKLLMEELNFQIPMYDRYEVITHNILQWDWFDIWITSKSYESGTNESNELFVLDKPFAS